jgi:hypothetical protein
LARYITSLTWEFSQSPLSTINAFSDVLAAARNLLRLSLADSDLALLAVIIARRTCADHLRHLIVNINEATSTSMLAHIGHFVHLHQLELRFRPYTGTEGAELEPPRSVLWKLPQLRSLSLDFQRATFVPTMIRVIANSNLASLREMTLITSEFNTTPSDAEEIARLFLDHSLQKIHLDVDPAAVPRDILVLLLPRILTTCLEVPLISPMVVEHLSRAVTELHSENMGFGDEEEEEGIWAGLDLLLRGGTAVRTFSTDEWWGNSSWIGFFQMQRLDERQERAQLRRLRYATLLGAKGIRFTDPQGKTMAEYMDGGR